MTALEEMNQDERSLLLYIEVCAVDYGGLVDSRKINDEDKELLKQWDEKGFISYSRLTWESVQTLRDKHNTSLVRLSEEAWQLAHQERRARNARMSSKPPYCDLITTKSKRAEFVVSEMESGE